MLNKIIWVSVVGIVMACGGKAKNSPSVLTGEATSEDNTSGSKSSNKSSGANNSGNNLNGEAMSLQPVIYFEFDSTALNEESRKKLAENAAWLKENEARMLTIEGHTDETGTTDYNLALGERRARETRDFLIRLGADEKRVSIITYGEERPASSNDDQNRRSMFIATKP